MWQEYFNLSARNYGTWLPGGSSGRELPERLRDIAAAYKLFLFDNNFRS
jgi:hypothetical protein